MTGATLYLVPATLADVKDDQSATLVAATLPRGTLDVIDSLEIFAVENAKSARAFLKAAGVRRPIQGLTICEIGHAPEAAMLQPLLTLLGAGRDVGLVSESGCPAVADPGALLVRMAHEGNFRVVPLVGPSALLLALMASGLDGQRFAFTGYLPVNPVERANAIRQLEERSRRERETQIAIETPYRNQALFDALAGALKSSTRLCVAVDLTLPGEAVVTRQVAQWRSHPPARLEKRPAVFLFLAAAEQAARHASR